MSTPPPASSGSPAAPGGSPAPGGAPSSPAPAAPPAGRVALLPFGAALAGWALGVVVAVVVGVVLNGVNDYDDAGQGYAAFFTGAVVGAVVGGLLWAWLLVLAARRVLPATQRRRGVVLAVAWTLGVGLVLGLGNAVGTGLVSPGAVLVCSSVAGLVVPSLVFGRVAGRPGAVSS